MKNKEKEDLKKQLFNGKITVLGYLHKIGGPPPPEKPHRCIPTEEEKRTGNTPRVRSYCRKHGL